MKKSITISLFLGAAVSVAALYFAFRNVPFGALIDYMGSINYVWVVPAAFLVIVAFALRIYRWQLILAAAYPVKFWQAFHPLMIGFMVNCILPGRVGEIVRPALLLKKERVPFSTGLATVAAERVFDIGTLITFFAILLATLQIDPELKITYGGYHLNRDILMAVSSATMKLCILLIFGIIMISVEKFRRLMQQAIMKLPAICLPRGLKIKLNIETKICLPLNRLIDNIASGFSMVKSFRMILACLLLSVAIWVVGALSNYIMILGCPGIELSLFEMTTVMIIVSFFIALPSVPGFWGIWEAGGVFAMSVFGISAKEAAGFTLANHAVQMFPVIIIGLVSAIVTGINFLRISREVVESKL